MDYITKRAKLVNPQHHSRLRNLQSTFITNREQADPPTALGLAALKRNAEFASSQEGKLLTFKMRPRTSPINAGRKAVA